MRLRNKFIKTNGNTYRVIKIAFHEGHILTTVTYTTEAGRVFKGVLDYAEDWVREIFNQSK